MSNPELLTAMKVEIQTLEQFDAIGKPGRVAMKYGIDHADAHLCRKELEKEAEELVAKQLSQSVAKMHAEIKTVAEFKAMGSDKDVAQKYQIGESTAGRYLTELRRSERPNVTEKPEPVTEAKPIVTESTEGVSEPQSTVPITPDVHQVDNGVLHPEELEELFRDKPDPDLSKLDVAPVISEDSLLVMAMEVIAKITEDVTMRQRSEAVEKVRVHFKQARFTAQGLIRGACSTSDKLYGQLRLEILEQIECGVITALNGRESA